MRPEQLKDHPWRQLVADEVHARPVGLVPGSGRVSRVAMQLPRRAGAVETAHEEFAAWCRDHGVPAPARRQHSHTVGGHAVTWELHNEFVTLTWTTESGKDEAWPEGIGLEALARYPLMAAARVDLLAERRIPERLIPGFDVRSLCISDIEGGRGQIATDLLPDASGFTRIEFACAEVSDIRRAIVVRRLLEIETYRAFALLALPLARELSPDLAAAEDGLSAQLERMGEVDTVEEARAALDRLHALSVAASRLAEKTAYRFAASFAYADVLELRLERLAEQSVGYASTLQRYLVNRIEPAIATCRAFEKRQAALAQKLDRAIELLNTRIGLDMQMQNRDVLSGISETARGQYRLQRTVEGLSTIAISYYALGILSYVLTGAEEVLPMQKPLVVALAAPFVLVLVWLGLRLIQRQHR